MLFPAKNTASSLVASFDMDPETPFSMLRGVPDTRGLFGAEIFSAPKLATPPITRPVSA
jgi:hypothetical protein